MKLQFCHQQFQADAANSVCDVFSGQPFHASTYIIDPGLEYISQDSDPMLQFAQNFTGFNNAPLMVANDKILEQIRMIQRRGQINQSNELSGHFNLTIEMETGVGKTYTYIKTIYELNKRYGWSKFIIVVPSVAMQGMLLDQSARSSFTVFKYAKQFSHTLSARGSYFQKE